METTVVSGRRGSQSNGQLTAAVDVGAESIREEGCKSSGGTARAANALKAPGDLFQQRTGVFIGQPASSFGRSRSAGVGEVAGCEPAKRQHTPGGRIAVGSRGKADVAPDQRRAGWPLLGCGLDRGGYGLIQQIDSHDSQAALTRRCPGQHDAAGGKQAL